jgi:hypothetical protein
MESVYIPSAKWEEGEHIDAVDLSGKLCNAEILRIDHQKKMVRIHYSGFNSRFDEGLPFDSERIQKQCKTI